MKKFTVFALALVMALSLLAGCGGKAEPSAPAAKIEGTPAEIIEKIYEKHKPIDLPLVTMDVDLSNPDAVAYHLGLGSVDKVDSAAMSETMLGQPYSLAVVRVKDAADAASIAREMYNNIDTRKWICVAADTKTAACFGDVVIFFMVNSDFSGDVTTDSLLDAFQAACGGEAQIVG